MRFSSLPGPAAPGWPPLLRLGLVFSSFYLSSHAISYQAVPSSNLDLSQLGRVGLAGDFDTVAVYNYAQQSETGYNTNGSQAILTQLPNGAFATLVTADAYIETMCPFVMKGGKLAGIVVGGNFTSLGGIEAQGIAMFDPSTSKVTPLPGLSGKVSVLLCDKDTNTVYVGGEFKGADSTNAIGWVGMTGWANLPFAGFNGPVTSITKAEDGNVIFGGSFDALGNSTSPRKKDQQRVNIAAAAISAGGSAVTAGFSDPKNILCKTDGVDGPSNTWLLADKAAGFWRADFQFGFRPTKLRIYNTHQDGRGTKTFRYIATPINGIMNLTYTDPDTGKNQTCDARCPLSSDPSVKFQDFAFVNVIGMSGFQIDISEFYGNGAGLNGIELFQDDIYAHAINDFNEPACAGIDFASKATSTGPWTVTPSQQSSSNYLSATLAGPSGNASAASIVFIPDITQSGNYSVTFYTPGCIQDGSCSNRGEVSISGVMATGTQAADPFQTSIFQTNSFDKYDQVYKGYVDASSDSFRPSVTLTPVAGQANNIKVVAQKVRFELILPAGGLNGLYEFDPNHAMANTDYSSSVIDRAGMTLGNGSSVTQLVSKDKAIYVAGNFSNDNFDNIFKIVDNKTTALTGGGLDQAVLSMILEGDTLYIGGKFSNTSKTKTDGLSNVAAYSTSDNKWKAMGAGVNGKVTSIVPVSYNATGGKSETAIAVTGDFDEILPYGSNNATSVQGLAVWVPSQKTWIQNVNGSTPSFKGQLSSSLKLSDGSTIYGGSLASGGIGATDAVTLSTGDTLTVNSMSLKIQSPPDGSAAIQKRELSATNTSGVVTGYFYQSKGQNKTILGGHFSATASNGSQVNNLLFVDNANNDQISGAGPELSSDATFRSLVVQDDILYAGGSVTGTINGAGINGLVLYDLAKGEYASNQPPAFSGSNVSVNVVSAQPKTSNIYVAGSFDTAGSLSCPSICIFATENSQWNPTGPGLTGTVATMIWAGENTLVVGGNLTVNETSFSAVTYDIKSRKWSPIDGADRLPGPVTALSAANGATSAYWVAGAAKNGSAFLFKYDGSKWTSLSDKLGEKSNIRGIQVLMLSESHGQESIIDQKQDLLVTGQLNIPGFGNASSAVFNGTSFTPFILSTSGNSPGSISQIFSEKRNYFKSGKGHLAVGFVVLIALAIALLLTFFLVVIGVIAERIRRKREGYVPAPTQMFDKNSNLERIPPSHLFGGLGQTNQGPGGAPVI